tara:strand:- start:1559 stop:1942 length:384 start_codon:yes stop_codon:yes gene_type:complete
MNTDDFIMYRDEKGNLSSGGFKVKSILANNNMPVVYKGGNLKSKMFFDNIDKYSVPLSLALLKYKYDSVDFKNQKGGNIMDRINSNDEMHLLKDGLHEKLLKLAGGKKRKTRKGKKKRRRKTRRLFK